MSRTLEEIAEAVAYAIDVDRGRGKDTAHARILDALAEAREGALREAASLAKEPADWMPLPYQVRLAKQILTLGSRPEPAPEDR